MSNIQYTQCPVCLSADISPLMHAFDYTVSNEKFDIWACNNCTCRFTQGVPGQESIGKYYQSDAYVSHSDTKQGFVNNLYHRVRNHTLQIKRKLVESVTGLHKGNLLDVGAGTGAFAAVMQAAGWKVTGLEPDDIAKENALKNHGLQLQNLDSIFSLGSNSFNAITMWHVLEHVHQLHEYVETFQRILTENGKLFIAVPNYTSGDAVKYGEHWAAWDVPRHLYHFSPKSMEILMHRHSFEITEYKPMWFDSFYVSMLSEKYKHGNNNMVSAMFSGLSSNVAAINDAKKCSSVIYVIQKRRH